MMALVIGRYDERQPEQMLRHWFRSTTDGRWATLCGEIVVGEYPVDGSAPRCVLCMDALGIEIPVRTPSAGLINGADYLTTP